MNDYEKQQMQAIEEWKAQEPGVVAQAAGFVFKPVAWFVEKVVPQKALEGALTAANKVAEMATDKSDILRDGAVSDIKELQTKDLELSDKLASEVSNWAMGIAAAEGFAAGATGLPGMAVDIPTLITLGLRTIHKIGLCYGFEAKSEEDIMFVYQVMSAAGANTVKEKVAAIAIIKDINVMIAKNTWKKLAEDAAANKISRAALVMTIKALAKRLGINITRRKALQAIPMIGGAVGAAMNTAFINDITWAARRSFQERWLEINNNQCD